jgi:uncharacterized protein (TIRG00374 family)
MTRTSRCSCAPLVVALKMALAFGLLALVIAWNREPIRSVLRHRLDGRLFAIGFGCYVAGLMLAYARWSLYVRALGLPCSVGDGLRLGFIANLYNFVVPGGPVGGDVVRAAFLCREHRTEKTKAVASVVLDRLVGLLALFLLAAVSGTGAWARLDGPVRRLVGVAWGVVVVTALLLALMFAPALYRPLARRFAHRKRLARRLRDLAATGEAYHERPGVVVLGLGMSLVVHTLNILTFYAVSKAMFSSVPSLAEHFLIVPLVLFTTAVPLPFAALGVSEGVSGHLFGLADYAGGAVAMMGFRVIQFASAVLSAGVYAANTGQARAPRKEAEPWREADIV